MSVVLVTGAATGIGNLTAVALARAGHTVFASMRDPQGRNVSRAHDVADLATGESLDLHAVALDVQSQPSADAAVADVLAKTGRLDVVVHNAGHLAIGYHETFSAEEIAQLLDINVLGAQRVNRAALPHLRDQRSGVLVYVGSTTSIDMPPFLGPYVVSKSAFDTLAQVTSYEVSQFGIETTIVMPGAFTRGTQHFPNASRSADTARAEAYRALDPLFERNEQATSALIAPDADPAAVADEIVRVLALPSGHRPARSVVDFTGANIRPVLDAAAVEQREFITRLGFPELLTVTR